MGASIPYTSIDGDDETRRIQNPLRFAMGVAGLALLGTAMVVTMGNHFPKSGGMKLSASFVQDVSSAEESSRPCSFDECYATHCNPEFAPYTCVWKNGGPHGGCSPTPWLPETCDDSCSLTACADMEIPDDVEGCTEACTTEWCEGDQACPSDVPYQCMDGSARFGCSSDPLSWTLRTDGSTCSSCCDASAC